MWLRWDHLRSPLLAPHINYRHLHMAHAVCYLHLHDLRPLNEKHLQRRGVSASHLPPGLQERWPRTQSLSHLEEGLYLRPTHLVCVSPVGSRVSSWNSLENWDAETS